MQVESVDFRGLDALALRQGSLEVVVTVQVGPRIVRFTRGGSVSLLADLPAAGLPLADGRQFTFYGGHRLWVAPEVPAWTYEPDDNAVTVAETADGVRFEAALGDVPVRKAIAVGFSNGRVVVRHSLVNVRDRAVDLAVWSITQLAPGGTALLPLANSVADPHGLQPNRTLVGWPYTDFGDARLGYGGGLVTVSGSGEPLKIGTEMRRGWLAYHKNGAVFVKRAKHIDGGRYVDKGASAQCYHSDTFTELETLSPAWELPPGEGTTHSETWELLEVEPGTSPHALAALVEETAA